MLRVTVRRLGEPVTLLCHGRIVHGQEVAVLCDAVRQNGRDMTLDLREVDAIDAGGLGALVSLRADGVSLKLMDPTARVRELLRLTRLDSIFEICESESMELMVPLNTDGPSA